MANLNNWILRGIELGLIKWVLLKEHEKWFSHVPLTKCMLVNGTKSFLTLELRKLKNPF